MRLNKLLKDLKKNDALYEPVINRYCELQAECLDLKQQRINLQELIDEIKETFRELTAEMNVEERASLAIELTRSLIKLTDGIDKIDKNIQSKRKMMFDIEKENIFTISAALRSIPKKEEKTANPLLEALKGGNVDES
jgi:predicted nuclease with TOPRIM domain